MVFFCSSESDTCHITISTIIPCVSHSYLASVLYVIYVTVRATHATLQSLLSSPVSATRTLPQHDQHHAIQVITMPTADHVLTAAPVLTSGGGAVLTSGGGAVLTSGGGAVLTSGGGAVLTNGPVVEGQHVWQVVPALDSQMATLIAVAPPQHLLAPNTTDSTGM